MTSHHILKVKRPVKPQLSPPPPLNDSAIEEAARALQQTAVETQQQPEPVVEQKAVFETPREQSVCGSGWRFAELLNEFNEQ